MKITIESTAEVWGIDAGGVEEFPARLWRGHTDDGVPVLCLIALISPQTHDLEALSQFDDELRAADDVRVEVVVERTQ